MGKRLRIVLAVVGGLVLLAGALIIVSAIMSFRHRAEVDKLNAHLEEKISDYERSATEKRWSPPPLRGASQDVNGAELQRQAAEKMAEPGAADTIKHDVCTPFSQASIDFAKAHEAELQRVRTAANATYGWSRTDLRLGPSAPTLPLSPAMRAHRLLLVLASLAEPAECLRISADVVRLAQLLVPGGGIMNMVMAAGRIKPASRVAIDCAARASKEELAAAALEYESLATNAPSFANTREIEVDYIVHALMFREIGIYDGIFPIKKRDIALAYGSPALIEAWKITHGWLDESRRIGEAGYPEALEIGRALWKEEASSDNLLIEVMSGSTQKWVETDIEGQAGLRATAVMIAALAERAAGGAAGASRAALAKPALRDPYSGEPLRFSSTEAGSVKVWAVGLDGKDDSASGDDVVVSEKCR